MSITLGLGCDRGTPLKTLEQAIREALADCGQVLADVVGVASIDLKADEAGLIDLGIKHGWLIHFYSPLELAEIPVPNPSEVVRRYTGTPSVSEAAALRVAGVGASLIVEKHKKRGPDGRNATVSIARIPS